MKPFRTLFSTLALSLLVGLASACAPELDEEHPGWKDPNCWQCHDKGDTHRSDKLPHQCADCHGDNGAKSLPAGHTDKTPCKSCHGVKHGGTDFPDPEACQVCHTR